jgi:hypothetical protein
MNSTQVAAGISGSAELGQALTKAFAFALVCVVFQGEHNVAKRTDKGRVMPRLIEKVAFLKRDTLVSGWLSLRS